MNSQSKNQISFNPPPVEQSAHSISKSLSQSTMKHKVPDKDQEMVSLTKKEFLDMIDQLMKDVVKEIKNTKPYEPDIFLSQKLKTLGQLKSNQTKKGIQYSVLLPEQNVQKLLHDYEQHYYQQQVLENMKYAREQQQEQYQYFLQFQQLLNYYSQTDPHKYKQLLSEYNGRKQMQLIQRLQPDDQVFQRQVNNKESVIMNNLSSRQSYSLQSESKQSGSRSYGPFK